jgi:hypothetical protein
MDAESAACTRTDARSASDAPGRATTRLRKLLSEFAIAGESWLDKNVCRDNHFNSDVEA